MNPLLLGGIFKIGEQLIERFFPDPEKKAEAHLKLVELQQSGELAKLASETEITKALLADAQSAREREVQITTSAQAPYLNKIIVPCLAIGVLSASFILFGVLLFVKVDPAHKDILIYILGVLSAIDTQIIAYFFGSSAGSTAKDQTLKRMMGAQ